MRKELLVYVNTTERNSELSVTALSNNRDFVLINTPSGKVTANRQELIEALKAIEEFDSVHNKVQKDPIEQSILVGAVSGNDVEYGDE